MSNEKNNVHAAAADMGTTTMAHSMAEAVRSANATGKAQSLSGMIEGELPSGLRPMPKLDETIAQAISESTKECARIVEERFNAHSEKVAKAMETATQLQDEAREQARVFQTTTEDLIKRHEAMTKEMEELKQRSAAATPTKLSRTLGFVQSAASVVSAVAGVIVLGSYVAKRMSAVAEPSVVGEPGKDGWL